MPDIHVYSTAREMAAAVAAKEISARELLELHLDRIEQVNPQVNAIVSMDVERSRAAAAEADEATARGDELGPLHGLPHAFKDTHEVAGWPTTFGSPLRKDYVPKRDELIAERIRAAGVVVVGKTNVPEWAAGSHTFNPIFGTTRNPYDLSRSAGGSSGGAAAALASGMVPLADGSDMGGSLRNPASFCNVVGLRPSVGRVPAWPTTNAWELTSVGGPMARNVDDLALLLSVIAGPSTRAPMSLETPGTAFAPPLDRRPATALRVALSTDLGGAFQVDDAGRRRSCAPRATSSPAAGAEVTRRPPRRDRRRGRVPHAAGLAVPAPVRRAARARPEAFKASLADNIRAGETLTGADVATAYQRLTSLAEKVRLFFEKHDVLVLPVSQVPPFDAAEEYPATINGQEQATYLDWMRSAFLITVTGCPAISVPAGFTREGWPVGVQIVAAPRNERLLLEVAHAFEQLTRVGDRRPDLTDHGRDPMTSAPQHPDRHRHRRHVHRRRRRRRAHRRARRDQDAVHAARPGRRLHGRRAQGARHARPRRRRGERGQPRHHRRHQQAARGQGREPRLHHHRGLRVHARDRPAVGARRLRQLLLLGEAGPDRAGPPGEDRGRPDERRRRGDPPVRPGERDAARPASSATQGINTIGVCFLHSYANDAHELAMRAILAEVHPEATVSISSEVLREYREYERSVTTLVDAAVKPNIRQYVDNIAGHLASLGSGIPFYVMKSNGGVLSAEEVVHQPITTVLSGPAAGALGRRGGRREGGLPAGGHL